MFSRDCHNKVAPTHAPAQAGRRTTSRMTRPGATIAPLGTRLLRVRKQGSQRVFFLGWQRGLFLGICHNDDWRVLVRLPKRILERGGGWQAAFSNRDVRRGTDREPCLQKDAGQLPRGRTISRTIRRGSHSPEWRAGCAHLWTVRCEAGGAFSVGPMCHSVKWRLPTVAITEHPHGEVLFGETVTECCQSCFSEDGRAASARSLCAACRTDVQAHQCLRAIQ